MVFGRVMRNETSRTRDRRMIGDGREKEVSFSRMEVATGRVDTEGPGGVAGGLPGREGEGIVQEPGQGSKRESLRRKRRRRGEDGAVVRGTVAGAGERVRRVEKREERGGEVA